MKSNSSGNVSIRQRTGSLVIAIALLAFLGVGQVAKAQNTGFSLGDAANYALLYNGVGNNQLSFNNSTISGNVGIGDPSGSTTAQFAVSGGNTVLNGNVNFAGAANATGMNSSTGTNTVNGGVSQVQTDLNSLTSLSSTLATETGTSLGQIQLNNNQSLTIQASSGTLDSSGNMVFTVNTSQFQFGGGSTITINGDTAGNNVVINFVGQSSGSVHFQGTLNLTGGLTANDVMMNITGGQTLQINTNGATESATFVDMGGTVTTDNYTIDGHIFGGGSTNNMQIVSGAHIYAPALSTPTSGSASVSTPSSSTASSSSSTFSLDAPGAGG